MSLVNIIGADLAAIVNSFAFADLPLEYFDEKQLIKLIPYFRGVLDFDFSLDDLRDYHRCLQVEPLKRMLKAQSLRNYKLVSHFKRKFFLEHSLDEKTEKYYAFDEKGLDDLKFIDLLSANDNYEFLDSEHVASQIGITGNVSLFKKWNKFCEDDNFSIILVNAIKNCRFKLIQKYHRLTVSNMKAGDNFPPWEYIKKFLPKCIKARKSIFDYLVEFKREDLAILLYKDEPFEFQPHRAYYHGLDKLVKIAEEINYELDAEELISEIIHEWDGEERKARNLFILQKMFDDDILPEDYALNKAIIHLNVDMIKFLKSVYADLDTTDFDETMEKMQEIQKILHS